MFNSNFDFFLKLINLYYDFVINNVKSLIYNLMDSNLLQKITILNLKNKKKLD